MTEEDQKLVALAALHGARFCRVGTNRMWGLEGNPKVNKWTIGRAANYYLWQNEMRSDDEHWEYYHRTYGYEEPQEIDPEFLSSVLA